MTAHTFAELVKKKQDLDQLIEAARRAEVAGAISKVKELVAAHSLTHQDIFGGAKRGPKAKGPKAGGTVAPKYRDPATGATWTGRGKAPKWIDGQDRSKFAI